MSEKSLTKTTAGAIAVSVIAALGVSGAQAQTWPSPKDRIEFMVPFNTGGSADRMARMLAVRLSKELNGAPINVTNRPGASGATGATFFAKQQSCDGSKFMVMQATPFLANAILTGAAPVKWQDFQVINTQWIDYAIIAVNKDSRFKTFDELLTAIESKKGAVSSATMSGSGSFMQQLALLEIMGLPLDQVRFVRYDGGGPVRTSVAGGQTDFTFVAATGSESIRDRIRSIGIVNDRPVTEWEGPLLNDVLKRRYNKELPIFSSYTTSVFTLPCFAQQQPERYKTFVAAYEKVMKDADFVKELQDKGVGALWIGPAESQKLINQGYEGLASYTRLLTSFK